jgi:hypothetical protein
LSSESIIRKRAPALPDDKVAALANVWDEVVDRIVQGVLRTHANSVQQGLHINIKPEMGIELAKLILFLTEQVIAERVGDRDLVKIDPDTERLSCLGAEGVKKIEGTAQNAYQQVWLKFLNERWLPKSRKAIEREGNPRPPAKLAVKPVLDKHFISRWLIRDYWAAGPKATCWRKSGCAWSRHKILFAKWGHQRRLWSDRLEAYFGLLEGDAKKPIQMLLATEPLNTPQQQAFIGFLVIHLLRNPKFIGKLRVGTQDVLEQAAKDAGISVDDMARASYETLYLNNDLYDRYARPLFWSQWAIVTSPEPVFVLPDTFCARGSVKGEHRLIVPLTPHKCFVTLAANDFAKRIVPFNHAADIGLARRMSLLLIQAADSEFLSHGDFAFEAIETTANFVEILESLQIALDGKV